MSGTVDAMAAWLHRWPEGAPNEAWSALSDMKREIERLTGVIELWQQAPAGTLPSSSTLRCNRCGTNQSVVFHYGLEPKVKKDRDALAAKNHATWNGAMERAAQMADAYAELYKSEAAKRIAQDCRACRLPLPEPSALDLSERDRA